MLKYEIEATVFIEKNIVNVFVFYFVFEPFNKY